MASSISVQIFLFRNTLRFQSTEMEIPRLLSDLLFFSKWKPCVLYFLFTSQICRTQLATDIEKEAKRWFRKINGLPSEVEFNPLSCETLIEFCILNAFILIH